MTVIDAPVAKLSPGPEPLEDVGRRRSELLAELFQLADLVRPWAIRAAAALGVADHLTAGPRSVEDLAATCGVEVRPLHALLRFLASREIFREVAFGSFALTPLAELMCSGRGQSLRDALVSPHEERFTAAVSLLVHSLQTGRSAYEELFGESLFEFCGRDPDARRQLDDSFSDDVSDLACTIHTAYDWSGVSHVVDVGGGTGELLSALLRSQPHLRGTLLELEQVIPRAAEVSAAAGVAERSRLVAGDFFVEVPAGADRYLLSNVLLNWDDERARRVLATCRRAMVAGSRLLVIERVVPPGNEPDPTKYLDVHLLVVCGGMQRTAGELQALLTSAGFDLRHTAPLAGPFSLLEAVPVADLPERRQVSQP